MYQTFIDFLRHLSNVLDISQIFPIAHLRPDFQACLPASNVNKHDAQKFHVENGKHQLQSCHYLKVIKPSAKRQIDRQEACNDHQTDKPVG